jgi:hypothetical protein
MAGKQAKILSPREIGLVLAYVREGWGIVKLTEPIKSKEEFGENS